MANALYPKWKSALLAGTANTDLDNDDTTDGPFCALVDTGTYTYSAAHDFYNDLSGIVGTDQRISTPTVNSVAEATFDGDNLTYTAVSGNSVEALVIYRKNSGANTTWHLVAFLDSSVTGLPVTPNGGNITVTWHASGIFLISDRRMKREVREVGVTPLGVPLYQYSYRHDPRRRVHVGVMAQDVARVLPRAVVDLGPCLAVDYRRVVAACERRLAA